MERRNFLKATGGALLGTTALAATSSQNAEANHGVTTVDRSDAPSGTLYTPDMVHRRHPKWRYKQAGYRVYGTFRGDETTYVEMRLLGHRGGFKGKTFEKLSPGEEFKMTIWKVVDYQGWTIEMKELDL